MREAYWVLEITCHRDGEVLHSITLDEDYTPHELIEAAVGRLEIAGWFPTPSPYEYCGVQWVKLDETGIAKMYRVNEKTPREYEEHPSYMSAVAICMWQNRGVINNARIEAVLKVLNEYNDPWWDDDDDDV